MNTKQALDTLKARIQSASTSQLADVVTILELGAGDLFLHLDTLRPCSLAEERQNKESQVLMELVDSVVYSTCDSNDEYQPLAEFVPCYSGQWELVLASLVLDQNWPTISKTANELRAEHASPSGDRNF